ncbi:MAG: arginine--tRNA ligase [Oricola sp.]|nr:MAG: arginine--tRNA ligase [Oricola sp.]
MEEDRCGMAAIEIVPEDGRLLDTVESEVRARLGPVALQTDFRRGAAGPFDVSVFVKSTIDKSAGEGLVRDLSASRQVETARLARQKLAIRFTDAFVSELLDRHARGDRASGAHAARRVVVCFCDPNANKALHVGHLRNAAIGGAIAALWRSLGAEVECQSVVCDIGRNVAEALAGLMAAGAGPALAAPGPLAPRLGELYATYVRDAQVSTDGQAEADAPIAREVARHDDEADMVLDRWRAHDPDLRALWKSVIERVVREQEATLARLGIGFERLVYESDAVSGADATIGRLAAAGLAFREASGAAVLETGRADYARCPLSRSDGFPTEHLRALALWDGLRDGFSDADPVVHVMGQEWRTSTEIRLDALENMRQTGFPSRYRIVPHQLVHLEGSDMKSSSGSVLLLDDLCDEVDAVLTRSGFYGDPQEAVAMARAAVMAPMLEADLEDSIDISPDALLDQDLNPGLRIARAIAATNNANGVDAITPKVRFLAFQNERIARMTETAALKAEPKLLVRQLIRLADERLAPDADAEGDALYADVEGDALLRRVLLRGVAALGWRE